jgi:hypothetical protein
VCLPAQHLFRKKQHGRTTTWQATCRRAQDWIDFPHAKQTMRLTRDRHNHNTGQRTTAIFTVSPRRCATPS